MTAHHNDTMVFKCCMIPPTREKREELDEVASADVKPVVSTNTFNDKGETKHRKNVIIAIVLILILVLAAGLGIGLSQNNDNESSDLELDALDEQYHTPIDEWLQVYGEGTQADPANTHLEYFADDSPYLPRSGEFYIRRLCVDCRDTHKDIIYKRLTPLPDGFSIFNYFFVWASENNELNEDFELYGNMLDALAERNKWTFCNYDDNNSVGFPRDCGPDRKVGGQWISSSRGDGRQNYGFYVYSGNVDQESTFPTPSDEDSLDR